MGSIGSLVPGLSQVLVRVAPLPCAMIEPLHFVCFSCAEHCVDKPIEAITLFLYTLFFCLSFNYKSNNTLLKSVKQYKMKKANTPNRPPKFLSEWSLHPYQKSVDHRCVGVIRHSRFYPINVHVCSQASRILFR